jgi:hypothetical protein
VALNRTYNWLANHTSGRMIHESPDGGKTVHSRPAADHPIQLLTNGKLPVDIWYKIYGNDHGI